MVATKKLYRVLRQHCYDAGTRTQVHSSKVLYCGYDRDEARRAYFSSTPADSYHGAGNYFYQTKAQSMECDE